ncbi:MULTISPECIES: spore coat associated protein CotJA [Lachnospiraceae]|jgi:hypothetical protein|nr:spore coat associated protein CotJA [Faecalicatena acetigenes]SCI09712.1 Spore coat associated protein JA (CotJA) [uncultured Clostridium sp.]
MANCQNNMRYGRQPSMRSPYMQNQNNGFRPVPEPVNHTAQNSRFSSHCPGHSVGHADTMPLAMAYVPWQKWQNIYDTCKAFEQGTIFQELDKPFHGKGGCSR